MLKVFPYDRILSAVSDDGLAWKREQGVRIDVTGRTGNHQGGAYFPNVLRLRGGIWRMYFRGSDIDRIMSATSPDGLVWTIEAGTRVDVGGTPALRRVSCPRVVSVGDSLRMYFTGQRAAGGGFGIFSAWSNDGLTWVREPGVRLDVDGRADYSSIFSFDVCDTDNGASLWLYFEGLSAARSWIFQASSADGLRWEHEGPVLKPSADEFGLRSPCLAPHLDGQPRRMYFSGGTRYRSLRTSLYSATSHDGLQWVRDRGVRIRYGGRYASDGLMSPFVVPLENGRLRMYYGAYWGWHLLTPLTRWRHRVP